MRYFFLLLLLLVSCKSAVRSPDSGLHAITDGQLTLGAVPSIDEQGQDAYRLLLCRNGHMSDNNFSNPNVCRSALIDDEGKEVILLSNKVRRRTATKYRNYAIAAGTALLAAGGAYTGIKWYKMNPEAISKMARSSDGVLNSLEHQKHLEEAIVQQDKLIDNLNQSIKKSMRELESKNFTAYLKNNEIESLQEQLSQALIKADSNQIKGIIKRFSNINKELGDELQSRIYGASGHLNPELLDSLTKRVDNIDSAFTKELQALKVDSRFSFGARGAHFYQTVFTSYKTVHVDSIPDIIKNFKSFIDTDGWRNYFDDLVRQKREAAELYEAAAELHHLEDTRKAMIAIRDGEFIDVAKTQADLTARDGITKFEVPPKFLDGLDANAPFTEKFAVIKKQYKELIESGQFNDNYLKTVTSNDLVDFNKHVDASTLEDLYLQGTSINNVMRLEADRVKYYQMFNQGKSKFSRELKQVDEAIVKARELLIFRDGARSYLPDSDSAIDEIWKKLADLKTAEDSLKQDRILQLDKEISQLNIKMTENSQQITKQRDLLAEAEARQLVTKSDIESRRTTLDFAEQELGREQARARELTEQLVKAREGEFSAIDAMEQALRDQRRRYGIDTAFIGSIAGAGAIALSLNKSIWGRGEKMVGQQTWNQIFVDDQDFTEATRVDDLPSIIRKIAQMFGQQLNSKALQLADL